MTRYNNNFRQKVINYLNSDQKPSKSEVIKIFQIARQTLYDWIKLDKQGKLFEITPKQNGCKSKVDLDELKKYVDEHPDEYYHEIAEHFSVGDEQIRLLVKNKLGYTSKKNKQSIEKQTKKLKKNLESK